MGRDADEIVAQRKTKITWPSIHLTLCGHLSLPIRSLLLRGPRGARGFVLPEDRTATADDLFPVFRARMEINGDKISENLRRSPKVYEYLRRCGAVSFGKVLVCGVF